MRLLLISLGHNGQSSNHLMFTRKVSRETATVYALECSKGGRTALTIVDKACSDDVKATHPDGFSNLNTFLSHIESLSGGYDQLIFVGDINLTVAGPVVSDVFKEIFKRLHASGKLAFVAGYTGDGSSDALTTAVEDAALPEMPTGCFSFGSMHRVMRPFNEKLKLWSVLPSPTLSPSTQRVIADEALPATPPSHPARATETEEGLRFLPRPSTVGKASMALRERPFPIGRWHEHTGPTKVLPSSNMWSGFFKNPETGIWTNSYEGDIPPSLCP